MTPGGMKLEAWLNAIGKAGRTTAHRWIRAGMIKPVNILGRLYITEAEDRRFWERAANGEFAREAPGIIEQQKQWGEA